MNEWTNEARVILIKLLSSKSTVLTMKIFHKEQLIPKNDIFIDIFNAIHLKTSSAHDRTQMETKRSIIFLFFSTIPNIVNSRKVKIIIKHDRQVNESFLPAQSTFPRRFSFSLAISNFRTFGRKLTKSFSITLSLFSLSLLMLLFAKWKCWCWGMKTLVAADWIKITKFILEMFLIYFFICSFSSMNFA